MCHALYSRHRLVREQGATDRRYSSPSAGAFTEHIRPICPYGTTGKHQDPQVRVRSSQPRDLGKHLLPRNATSDSYLDLLEALSLSRYLLPQ